MPQKKPAVHRVGAVTVRKFPSRSDRWYLDYWLPSGERVQVSTRRRDLEAALRAAGDIDQKIVRGDYSGIAAGRESHTVGQLLDTYLEHTTWNENTRQATRGILEAYRAEWGSLEIRQLNQARIEGYLARRRDEGLSAATHNRYLSALRQVLKLAVRWHWLAASPADGLRQLREEHHVPVALTEAQLEEVLRCLPTRAKSVVLLAADTGLRCSELERLLWSDVDWEQRQITVRKSKNKEWRVVPLTGRALALLRELRRDAGTRLTVLDWHNPKRALETAGRKAGAGHVHFHMLRHTFATRLLDAGVPVDRIQALLGHKTITLTMRYAKTRPEHLRGAIDAMDERGTANVG